MSNTVKEFTSHESGERETRERIASVKVQDVNVPGMKQVRGWSVRDRCNLRGPF